MVYDLLDSGEQIRTTSAPTAKPVEQPRRSLRQAFIWSEVLGKPVSDR